MKKCFKFLKIVLVGILSGWMVVHGGMGMVVEAVFAMDDETGDRKELPELFIKSLNPGYTIDGKNNVGEMFEIAHKESSDEMISLAGVTVRYTNTSGNASELIKFPENSYLAGETLLLRLASSPNSELANLVYKKTLAMNAKIELLKDEEVIDVVCWTGKSGCLAAFNKDRPTTLVRNLETGEFEHLNDYEPNYVESNYVIDAEESDENELENVGGEDEAGYGEIGNQCKGLEFSEILSYYAEAQTEQFVEFYNPTAEQILVDGCQLRYKNKLYPLSGIVKPEGYLVRFASDFKLTKNPTNFNTLELIDINGEVVDKLDYPNGQRKGMAYAMIGHDEKGEELWRTTYAVTPEEPNIYQEFKTCEAGKVINEATGNCVKVTEVVEKICAEGQYLNPLTGRCKKIETAKITTCKEGYYYYEPTGRCRKIVENNGADYSLGSVEMENYEEKGSFIAIYAVVAVVGLGLVYVIYEYRKDIGRFIRRLLGRH